MPEKRKYRRLSLQPLRCRVYQEGEIVDLSIGGAFISSTRPLPKGSTVTLEFKLPDHGTVKIGTIVEWSGDYYRGERSEPLLGMGLSFVTIDATHRVAITRYLTTVYEISHASVRVRDDVRARVKAGERWTNAYVREIGERGLLLETTASVPEGTEVDVQIRLPGSRVPVEAHGTVTEISDTPAGLRIDLLEVSLKTRELLRSFLDEAREDAAADAGAS